MFVVHSKGGCVCVWVGVWVCVYFTSSVGTSDTLRVSLKRTSLPTKDHVVFV